MAQRILLYYKYDHVAEDRWFAGDRHLRKSIRRLLRGPEPIGGIDLVFLNLCAGFDRLGIEYYTNLPFDQIKPGDRVGAIGRGSVLDGYSAENRIIAGVAVAQHPDEWPTLFEDYPVAQYLVHCDWVAEMYRRVYGDRVSTWAVGIDTDRWCARPTAEKTVDFLIYDKVRWDHDRVHRAMVAPILREIERSGLSTETIRYGHYKPDDFAAALSRARALLFLCEHETQGLAYQQAMAAGLPVLAWDPGQWLDPWRFRYGGPTIISATSVPFFDERCGATFTNAEDFPIALEMFLDRYSIYDPRAYVLENLTLERSAQHYLDILEAYAS